MRGSPAAPLLMLVALTVTACGSTDVTTKDPSPQSATSAAPHRASVPLTVKDKSKAVDFEHSASVTNDDYGDGVRATLRLRARTTSRPGPYRHSFAGHLDLADGTTIRCGELRFVIWSKPLTFEGIQLPCDKRVQLGQVRRFVVTDSYTGS